MSEWLKFLIGAAATTVGVYVTLATDVNDHTRRIDRLEKWSEGHTDKHEAQLEKIDGRLSKIEISLARIAGDDSRNAVASSIVAQPGRK